MIVRTVTSDGLSETRSVSPKYSPSVSRAIRRSLPWTPLLRTSTCPWAMMKNLLRSSPSTISLLPSETSSVLKRLAMRAMIVVRQPGEQRHAAQRLGRKRSDLARHIHVDPLGLGQFDLGAIDAVGAPVHLHPRQQAQQPPRGDRHHLRATSSSCSPGSWRPRSSRFAAVDCRTCSDPVRLRAVHQIDSGSASRRRLADRRLTPGTAWSTGSVRPGRAGRRRSVCRGFPAAGRLAGPPRPPRRN